MTSTQGTKEQAQQTAATAADEGQHVAGVIGDEAQRVAGQAKNQVRGLMDEALGQVDEQSRTQRDRLVDTLHSLGEDLEDMASSADSGLAADLTRQAAERARTLGNHLEGREPTDILGDVRDFARRRPGVFLLGALGAGVAVGRLARATKQSNADDSSASAAIPTTNTASATPRIPAPEQISTPIDSDPTYPAERTSVADETRETAPRPAEADLTSPTGPGSGPQGTLP